MRLKLKAPLFGAVCGMLLLAATPSGSAVLPSGVNADAFAVAGLQKATHTTPAGKQCLKWTRRFNSRHGYGHRRCVHWR